MGIRTWVMRVRPYRRELGGHHKASVAGRAIEMLVKGLSGPGYLLRKVRNRCGGEHLRRVRSPGSEWPITAARGRARAVPELRRCREGGQRSR